MKAIQKNSEPYPSRESGFSILEILMAISILAIGILGVAYMQIQSGNTNTQAGKVTQNMSWAAEFAEFVLRLPYNDPLLNPGTFTPAQPVDGIDNNFDGRIDEAGESGDISISWVVSEHTVIRNTKLVQVTVSQQRPGAARPIHAITINQVRAAGI